jgi:hypothetical protein
MPDTIVTANNLIGQVAENFSKFLALGSGDGAGFKLMIANLPEESVQLPINENAKSILVMLAQLRSQALLDTEEVTVPNTNKKLKGLREQPRYEQSIELLNDYDEIRSLFQELFDDLPDRVPASNIADLLEKRLLKLMSLERLIVSEVTDDRTDSTTETRLLKTGSKTVKSTAKTKPGGKS